MIEYFQSQIEHNSDKEEFKLFYFLQSGNFEEGVSLEMKSIKNDELIEYDFSSLEFLRLDSLINGICLPTFKPIGA